jgi:hypothetical protein
MVLGYLPVEQCCHKVFQKVNWGWKKHTHIHTYTHMCTHTYIHIYVHAHIHTYTYIYAHAHTYIHIYTHTYTHTHTYIHIYTHVLHPFLPHIYSNNLTTVITVKIGQHVYVISLSTHSSPSAELLSPSVTQPRADLL